MEANTDFKAIWKAQKVATPDTTQLFKRANKLKKKGRFTLLFVSATLLLTIIYVSFIWYYYQPEFMTTKIGIVLAIIAMLVFLVPFKKQFSILDDRETTASCKEYLQQLIALQKAQTYQQTKILSSYFVMLSSGISFYLIEFVTQMTFLWGTITYSLTFLWFAFVWWYLRPRIILEQNKKLNNLVGDFKKVAQQMID